MKFALVKGKRKNIKDAVRGEVGYDCWHPQYTVQECVGHYLRYWKYVGERPLLPEGYENETEWHAAWKNGVKEEYCEVICGNSNEHRADIKTPDQVIEIQYSSISHEAATERSEFYRNLMGENSRVIWIVNVYSVQKNIRFLPLGQEKAFFKVDWKYPKKWVKDIAGYKNTRVYLDLLPRNNKLVHIWRHGEELFGNWETKEHFFATHFERYSEISFQEFRKGFLDLNLSDYCR